MKTDFQKREDWYMERFGVLPAFKAGFHYGKVTTGEIGAIKKEIVFTGDVLNTTARIQGLCNTYIIDILNSASLINQLQLDSEFRAISLDSAELRGNTKNMELFTIK
jgi:adenylate cyclase